MTDREIAERGMSRLSLAEARCVAMEIQREQRERIRDQIGDLQIYPVVGDEDEPRIVRDRNHTEQARLIDAVLLDHVWEILDVDVLAAAAPEQKHQRPEAS